MYSQKQETTPLIQPQKEDRSFLHKIESAVLIYWNQSIRLVLYAFALSFFVGWRLMGYVSLEMVLNCVIISVLVGGIHYVLGLRKWGDLVTRLEELTGLDLNRDQKIGRTTMFLRVDRNDGNDGDVADFGVPQEYKDEVVIIARRAFQDATTSQQDMQRIFRISRGHWNNIMAAFVKANVLRKENPGVSNSRYIIAEPEAENREVLRKIAEGQYQLLDDIWETAPPPS